MDFVIGPSPEPVNSVGCKFLGCPGRKRPTNSRAEERQDKEEAGKFMNCTGTYQQRDHCDCEVEAVYGTVTVYIEDGMESVDGATKIAPIADLSSYENSHECNVKRNRPTAAQPPHLQQLLPTTIPKDVSETMQILIVILLFLTSCLVKRKALHWEMGTRGDENGEG